LWRIRIQLRDVNGSKEVRPMTAIDERATGTEISSNASAIRPWPVKSGSMPDETSSRTPTWPPPLPGSEGERSTGEAEIRTLRIARFTATAITALIVIASFVLSFSSLWDLASRSVSWPRDLAWLWPLIVDGVVIVATIAIRALTNTAPAAEEGLLVDAAHAGDDQSRIQQRRDRAFFWWMLVAAASVSVVGNGLHSLLPAGQPLSPLLSVVIGCVPACALLATTHALQRLSRLQIPPPAEVAGAGLVAARAAEIAEQRDGKWRGMAAAIHDRGLLTNQSTDTLATAMTYLFDVKPTP
jgi:hypothetical protein